MENSIQKQAMNAEMTVVMSRRGPRCYQRANTSSNATCTTARIAMIRSNTPAFYTRPSSSVLQLP